MKSPSHLYHKSNSNKEAGNLLIENELYASSVHCFYYCVLQFLIDEYKDKTGVTFEQITKETAKGKGTHNYIIEGIYNHIKSTFLKYDPTLKNVELTNLQKLKRQIDDLKTFRVKADYHNVMISKETSLKAKRKSEYIIEKTNNFLS